MQSSQPIQQIPSSLSFLSSGAAGHKNWWGPLEGARLWSLWCLCVSSSSSLLSLWKLRRGGCHGLSPVCRQCCCRAGTPRPGSVSPAAHVQRKGSQAWQPSPVWCFSPAITKQLRLLLSTAHHRSSFSALSVLMGWDCTGVVLPLLRWFPVGNHQEQS